MGLLDSFSEYIRNDIELYHQDTATDDYGQTQTSYPTNADTTISGLIQPLSGNMLSRAGGLLEGSQYILYTEATILRTDRIKQDGITYAVTFIPPKGPGGLDDHSEVYLEVLNV